MAMLLAIIVAGVAMSREIRAVLRALGTQSRYGRTAAPDPGAADRPRLGARSSQGRQPVRL